MSPAYHTAAYRLSPRITVSAQRAQRFALAARFFPPRYRLPLLPFYMFSDVYANIFFHIVYI